MAPSQPPDTALRYRLAPDEEARAAIEATFADYHRMMDMLDAIAAAKNIGANLVALHGHAYDAIRKGTRLPSRLVTLGLRDRASYRAAAVRRLPLDERLVNVKNAATVSLGTAHGRFIIPSTSSATRQAGATARPRIWCATTTTVSKSTLASPPTRFPKRRTS